MDKNIYLIATLFFLLLLNASNTIGQNPVKPVSPTGIQYKKPLVKSFISNIAGTTSLNAAVAGEIISQPIYIIDDKKVNYKISSYQFSYKRIGVTEDEESGKVIPQSDIAADRFTTTPLPAVWQKNIKEGLHKGEELYFFDIIVFDKQGHRFFAPEIKITIQ